MDEFYDMRLDEFQGSLKKSRDDDYVQHDTDTSDYGRSIYAGTPEPAEKTSYWSNVMNKLSDCYRGCGLIKGTLKALGVIAVTVAALPVAMAKKLMYGDIGPVDASRYRAEADMRNMKEKADREYYTQKGKEKREREKVSNEPLKPLNISEKDIDRERVSHAVNNLRSENEDTGRKTVAGLPNTGYSKKMGSLLFFNKSGRSDSVNVTSETLSSPEVGNKVAGIFFRNALVYHRENEMTEDERNTLYREQYVKAACYLAAISYHANNDVKKTDTLSSLGIDGRLVEFKVSGGWENMNKNGDGSPMIDIFADGKKVSSAALSNMEKIDMEIITEIIDDMETHSDRENENPPIENNGRDAEKGEQTAGPKEDFSEEEYEESEYEDEQDLKDMNEEEPQNENTPEEDKSETGNNAGKESDPDERNRSEAQEIIDSTNRMMDEAGISTDVKINFGEEIRSLTDEKNQDKTAPGKGVEHESITDSQNNDEPNAEL